VAKKVLISFIIALLFPNFILSQEIGDTITVRSFNYTQTYGVNQWSPGIRDTVIDFSDLPDISFEKVLMTYNMRCKDGKVSPPIQGQTDIGCGEWDISCNTYLHDSTRVDSVRNTHLNFAITGFSGTVFPYLNTPVSDKHVFEQKSTEILNTIAENRSDILVSDGSEFVIPQGVSGKTIFLVTADELSQSGLEGGLISALELDAINEGNLDFLRVRIAETKAEVIDQGTTMPLTTREVYFKNTVFSQGTNKLYFHREFDWDGNDNLLVEITYTNTKGTDGITLSGMTTDESMSITNFNNSYAEFTAEGQIEIPAEKLASINDEITISFWAFGNDSLLPRNTSVMYAEGANEERDINIHLPWSNNRIYWDCGGDDSGFDRLDKEATTLQIRGRWNHWAFTKNAISGSMEIYLNGNLWATATDKQRPIDINRFVIGTNLSGNNNFKGALDEIRIWNKALTGNEIKEWMKTPVTNSHPSYQNLLVYYTFDSIDEGIITDSSPNLANGTPNDNLVQFHYRGKQIDKSFANITTRPSLSLFNGEYEKAVTSINAYDDFPRLPSIVRGYQISEGNGTFEHDEVEHISTSKVWSALPVLTIEDATGTVLEQSEITPDGVLDIQEMEYYQRWPAKYEIMSFVTPYGVRLDLGPEGKTWTFDVTDFLPIFKDTKRMTIEKGGQWMEDMDIRFHFIVGTPPREVIDIQQMWRNERRGYQSINSDRFFPPRDYNLNPDGRQFVIRSTITGHGQEGEFIPRNHHLNINGGQREFSWLVWTECSDNPIYPQGGTWVYDRAGWCPGAPSDIEFSDITPYVSPGGTVNIDYDVDVASGSSNYLVNHQLVTYGAPSHELDARILEVREPSNRVEFSRFNSICHEPVITIQNTGSTELTSATIKYWINNSETPMTLDWTGSLSFMESETVILSSTQDLWKGAKPKGNIFHVEITSPNGGTDNYTVNDRYSSPFTIPEVIPSEFMLRFMSNNAPHENSYNIVDDSGNIIFERNNLNATTLYTDTIRLSRGCYTFNVIDTDQDGLEWWANNDGGGFAQFRGMDFKTIKSFESDFGDNIHFNFTVDYPLTVSDQIIDEGLRVFPNPASDELKIEFISSETSALIELFDLQGRKVLTRQEVLGRSLNKNISLDITSLVEGFYTIKVTCGSKFRYADVIKK